MLKKKLIIGLIGFYIFWLCILPLVISSSINFVCQKFSKQSPYEVVLQKPLVKFSVLPKAIVSFDKMQIHAKDDSLNSNLEKGSITIRLFPLLSGKLHINNIMFDDVSISLDLLENLVLDKYFIEKIKNTPIM